MIREYRALHAENGITWQTYAAQSEFDAYAVYYPELRYDESPTCAWNPTPDENSVLADVALDAPFVMTNNAYPVRLPVRWRNDEGRTFPRMTDVVTARMCHGMVNRDSRQYAGCRGTFMADGPPLSSEM